MSRFFISLLFLTFTFATIIGATRYYDDKVEQKSTLTIAEIEMLMKQNPTATGIIESSINTNIETNSLVKNDDEKELINLLK